MRSLQVIQVSVAHDGQAGVNLRSVVERRKWRVIIGVGLSSGLL